MDERLGDEVRRVEAIKPSESRDSVLYHEVALVGAPAEEFDGTKGEGVRVGAAYFPEAVQVVGADEGANKICEDVRVRGGEGSLELK